MRIDANMKGDFEGFRLHRQKDSGVVTATVGVCVRVEESKAREIFGDVFHGLAFGSMRKETTEHGETVASFGYSAVKPRITLEAHQLKLAKQKPCRCMPEIAAIVPDGNHAAVLVHLRFPLSPTPELRDVVFESYGKSIDVGLKSIQIGLPGMDDDGGSLVIKKSTGRYGNDQAVAT